MLGFIKKIMEHRIEQIRKSAETTKEEETNTSKNINEFNLSERYREVLILLAEIYSLYEESKIPKIIKKMVNQLEVKANNLFKNSLISSTEINYDDILILAMVYLNLGYIYTFKEVNLNTAKDYYMRCTELMMGKELHYKFIVVAIYALIFLHGIWKKLQQLENCYSLLDKALELYLSYTKEDDYPEPFADIFFCDKENSKIRLIKCHILTLEYMEDLYCLQPTNMHKFVIYVHNLLNEQLKTIKDLTENHMFLYWAEASAGLSVYFLYSNRLMEAKIHLAAADYMTMMYYVSIITEQDNAKYAINKYQLVHLFITKLWAMYGIMLLRLSKERLLQHKSNKSCEANNIESESHSKSEEEITIPLTFVDLEKGLKNIIKYHITDTYVSNFDDIKIIFGNVSRWLEEIFMYFSEKNQFISEVQTILCISEAYKYYVYFEGNKSEQIKIIKRHIKILENFISGVSSKYNTLPECHFKKLHFELAITYSTLLSITSEEADEIEEFTDEMRKEMKQLVTNVIHKFNLFTNLS
ncbi:KIF-binding protein [Camponotus japonicus]